MEKLSFLSSTSWLNGLIDLPWWGYIAVALSFTHITIASVTIYLHRHSAHRALDLHPSVAHFFRFWLWLTTGMVTKAWTAIHRKHHAKCETEEDPHSPQVAGLKKVVLEGAELYRDEAKNKETLEKYGHGTPDDWVEKNIYSAHEALGIWAMFVIDVALFGAIGITIWAVQMLWIPVFAAGVINGVGHALGYRNFNVNDASTNIVPWGILIGGEELHNNHHAYASSAKLSSRWFEFDIGWLYIRTLEILGLAKVKRLTSKIEHSSQKENVDAGTLQAIITHRWDVLAKSSDSIKSTCIEEIRKIAEQHQFTKPDIHRWLKLDKKFINPSEIDQVERFAQKSSVLKTVITMREELTQLWAKSSDSKEHLLEQLRDWVRRAEQSGISPLKEFANSLKGYAIATR